MTVSSATLFVLIISRHGHDSHHHITQYGYVFCMGLCIHSPAYFPSLLRCPRRRILGLYRSQWSKLTAATLNKFPQGAWFPFMVAAIMTSFMAFWRWGMSKKRQYEWDKRVRL